MDFNSVKNKDLLEVVKVADSVLGLVIILKIGKIDVLQRPSVSEVDQGVDPTKDHLRIERR